MMYGQNVRTRLYGQDCTDKTLHMKKTQLVLRLGRGTELLISFPRDLGVPIVDYTITEIKVDQSLIWDTNTFRLFFEELNYRVVQIDSHLLLECFCIRIFSRIQGLNIVFFSHDITSILKIVHRKHFALTWSLFLQR